MSAGIFEVRVYFADYAADVRHPIRVQPETVGAEISGITNSDGGGVANSPISARSSGPVNSGFGIRARFVTLRLPSVDPPAGYKAGGIVRIPALQRAFWDAANKGTVCTYLGVACSVVSRKSEYVG